MTYDKGPAEKRALCRK